MRTACGLWTKWLNMCELSECGRKSGILRRVFTVWVLESHDSGRSLGRREYLISALPISTFGQGSIRVRRAYFTGIECGEGCSSHWRGEELRGAGVSGV